MENQHREADRLYAGLKAIAGELQNGRPASRELRQRYRTAPSRLAELYRFHMAAEDATLIALSRRVLSAPELAEISREMKNRRRLSA